MKAIDALESRLGAASPLFQSGQLRGYTRRLLLQAFTFLPQGSQLGLLLVKGRFGGDALRLQARCFLAFLFDHNGLGFARVFIAGSLQGPILQTPFNTLCLCLHLLQCRALVCGVVLGLPPLRAACFQLRIEFCNCPRKFHGFRLGPGHAGLKACKALFRFAQFTLQALGGEKEGVAEFAGQSLGLNRTLYQIAISKLGQNCFQRSPKPVQHPDGVFERRDPRRADEVVAFFPQAALRGLMNQEGSTAVHARLQKPNAFFSRSPALNHHVVQLVAQELVHHILVLAAYFNKISQRTHRRHPVRQRTRLQKPPHRVSGVAVVVNQCLKRIAPASNRGLLAAQLVCAPSHAVLMGTEYL